MLSTNSGMSFSKDKGADALGSATKSPHKKARSEYVARPLNVLRAALMHVPAAAGTHAIQGIPKDFGVRTQALCDTIAGLIKKVHTKSEFETLLEDFKIFEKRSQGTPTTYECRVSHILYILTRGMAADPNAKCSVSFSDCVAVPTITPVAQRMAGATPCPRPGCKCTDRLNRRNKYCCSTCSKGIPCTYCGPALYYRGGCSYPSPKLCKKCEEGEALKSQLASISVDYLRKLYLLVHKCQGW